MSMVRLIVRGERKDQHAVRVTRRLAVLDRFAAQQRLLDLSLNSLQPRLARRSFISSISGQRIGRRRDEPEPQAGRSCSSHRRA